MRHYGDITKINGYDVSLVDIITGGSPCQDLSVAGKRSGLAGERSGLFMEQIRIVKEMRDESKRRLSVRGTDFNIRYIKPRYMVWENVAGAFTSGNPKGADFQAVLEEIVKIVCKECPDIPIPKEGWHYAGNLDGVGDDGCPFSICWRLHNACMWGVPQRRKRISLVADFGGQSAPEILFEREGLPRDSEQSEQERKGSASNLEEGSGRTNYTIKVRGGAEYDRFGKRAGKGVLIQKEMSGTIGVVQDQTLFQNIPNPITITHDLRSARFTEDGISDPLTSTDYKEPLAVCYGVDAYNQSVTGDKMIVRRLTPMECERLQGFPDGWTDIGEWIDSKGKKHKDADTPRYKALGNSLALPFWEWMAGRMCDHLRSEGYEKLTMASLFDGIGGFPLVYQRNGCSPVWASEIEEFPIAVTKLRFGEDEEEEDEE